MADDDHEVPARPASRGPRVVTGDMLKGKARGPRVVTGASVPPPPPDEDPDDEDPGDDDGDPTAETLVEAVPAQAVTATVGRPTRAD